MDINFTQRPSGKCPVQAEGTINGDEFYFRSRGGNWSISIAKPGVDVMEYEDTWYLREEYKGKHHHKDLEAKDGHLFAAGWADGDECIEFILRASKMYAAEISLYSRS